MTIEQRKLSCQLTEAEKTERAKQTTRLMRRYGKLEEEKKEITKKLGGEMKETRRAMDMLSAAFETGVEERMVDCRVEIRGLQRTVIRTDTSEIVEERPLTEDEIENLDAGEPSGTAESKPKTTRVSRKKAEGEATTPPSTPTH